MNEINPQLPYYLTVYLLTVIQRFIKVYQSRPLDLKIEEKGIYKFNYFFFGFELVNVSAGVFILLSEYAPKYFAALMMFYVVLLMISYFCEDSKVDKNLRLAGHIFSSLAVIAMTFYTFTSVGSVKYVSPTGDKEWKVNLTYIDTSMNRLLASKNTVVKSSFSVNISSPSRHEAIAKARDIFYSEQGPVPFVNKAEKGPASMIVIDNESVVELIQSR